MKTEQPLDVIGAEARARAEAIRLLTGEKVSGGDGGTYVIRTPSVDELTAAFLAFEQSATAETVGSGALREAAFELGLAGDNVLAAMDRYNTDNGTYIGGPAFIRLGKAIAKMSTALSTPEDTPKGAFAEQAGMGELAEAIKPFADFHGELPAWDDPLRCVYESGIQYAVELLAKTLDVTDYDVCDGTEEFDGDLGGTMFNIVLAAMPEDEHGDRLHPSEVRAALAPRATAVEREALARAIYAVQPIRVINRPEPLSFDEVTAQGMWREPDMSYKRADAALSLLQQGEGK